MAEASVSDQQSVTVTETEQPTVSAECHSLWVLIWILRRSSDRFREDSQQGLVSGWSRKRVDGLHCTYRCHRLYVVS